MARRKRASPSAFTYLRPGDVAYHKDGGPLLLVAKGADLLKRGDVVECVQLTAGGRTHRVKLARWDLRFLARREEE